MHQHYNVRDLTQEQRRDILIKAHEFSFFWWVDILDCQKSCFARQKIDMPFDEIMAMFDKSCFFTVIHRLSIHENHVEFSFNTMGKEPSYYLWINVQPYKARLIIRDLKLQ